MATDERKYRKNTTNIFDGFRSRWMIQLLHNFPNSAKVKQCLPEFLNFKQNKQTELIKILLSPVGSFLFQVLHEVQENVLCKFNSAEHNCPNPNKRKFSPILWKKILFYHPKFKTTEILPHASTMNNGITC